MKPVDVARVAVLAVCVLAAGVFGGWQGWRTATVAPPAPPPVCPLVRPEIFTLLAPGHGPLRTEQGQAPGERWNYCIAEGETGADGRRGELAVGVTRYGRSGGRGPSCLARDGLRPALNRQNHPVALGDAAVYWLEGSPDTGRVLRLTACSGTYRVAVEYAATGIGDAAIVEAAVAVGQEVLAKL
ncbi:hypothetical protein [Plantactinospora sp. B5E13]|uniref:hypothetical protein n=1 Tax=Plantactinospora sp. B5E13 TaxID=3153758 RepID=UPI00325E4733